MGICVGTDLYSKPYIRCDFCGEVILGDGECQWRSDPDGATPDEAVVYFTHNRCGQDFDHEDSIKWNYRTIGDVSEVLDSAKLSLKYSVMEERAFEYKMSRGYQKPWVMNS